MTSTPRTAPSPAQSPDRSVLMDFLAFTPSATLGRELLALVVNLALIGVLVLVIQPEPLAAAVMFGIVGLFMAARLVAGFRTRGYARELTGGR